MGLFKSREQRRLEREVEIRKGMNLIKRNVRDLERNESAYLQKAKRARQLGAEDQYRFLKQAVARSARQRKLMERQLLSIETAYQIKNQAEAHGQFAQSMAAVSRSIGEMFGATDLMKTQADFEEAMAKAQTMEERMEVFLEMSAGSIEAFEGAGEEGITGEEIDARIDREIAAEESGAVDREIEAGLSEIRREIGKE